jgi:DNA-binding CsgD family transcriptional regulator
LRALVVDATAQAGWIAVCQGRRDTAETLLGRCLTMLNVSVPVRGIPDLTPDLPPSVMFLGGAVLMLVDRDPRAVDVLAHAQRGFLALGPEHRGSSAMAELFLALSCVFFSVGAEALRVAQRCQDNAEATNAEWAISWARIARGMALMWHGDRRRAVELLRIALRRQMQMGDGWGSVWAAHAIAWAWAATLAPGAELAQDVRVARARYVALLIGGSDVLRVATGVDMEHGLGPFHDATVRARAVAQDILGDGYMADEDRGRALSYRTVLEIAAGSMSPDAVLASTTIGAKARSGTRVPARSGTGSPRWLSLTERQREVAVLAAAGWTNQRIARVLRVALSTVKKAMGGVLAKLEIDRREQIAPYVPVDERFTAEDIGASPSGSQIEQASPNPGQRHGEDTDT